MKRRWAVVQFPGSNCDYDALKVFQHLPEIEGTMHWHEKPIEKGEYEVIVLPGGFSFGDYLRAGAIAKISPVIASLPEAIDSGAHVLGICNGFQILLECRMLPGFLQVNQNLRFISEVSPLEVTEAAFPWFTKEDVGTQLRFPIAHRFGNYQLAPKETLQASAVLRYKENPNGSYQSTAGVYRKQGKGSLFGLMPHPERAAFQAIRLMDGLKMFQTAVKELARS